MTRAFRALLAAALVATPLTAGEPMRMASLELVETDTDAADIPKVTFAAPLTQGGAEVEGKSLEELIQGSPVFAPFEGLPEALWKSKTCSDCHQWSREDLCEHGRRFVNGALEVALTKPHPYGGGFKQNVYYWARNGCQ